MEEVLKIVVMGRACRNASNIKNRQPVAKMYVKAPVRLDDFYVEIIEDELNKALSELDGNAAMDRLNAGENLHLQDGDTDIELSKDDLLIDMTQKAGFVSQEDGLAEGSTTVVIDTNLTPELIEEGIVAELISKIQTMRKDSGFEVMDRIRLSVSGNPKIYEIARRNAAVITGKVLADTVLQDTALAHEKEWNINGETVKIGVEKQ